MFLEVNIFLDCIIEWSFLCKRGVLGEIVIYDFYVYVLFMIFIFMFKNDCGFNILN